MCHGPKGGPSHCRCPHARLAARPERQAVDKITLDRLRRCCVAIRLRDRRRLGGEGDAKALVGERSNDARPCLARSLLDEAGQVGDALGGGKAADGAHGLLAVRGVNPRADAVGEDQSGQEDEQGLPEQALGEEAGHAWLTAGVNV
jgi:hypothetical protein